MKTQSIGFIGGGRITKIFLQAFANRKVELNSVKVFDTNADVLAALKAQFPFIATGSLEEIAGEPTVLIALHPPMIMETLDKIVGLVTNDAVVISLAPKITIAKIASKLNTPNIARMIPNASSYINEGFNPMSFAENFSTKSETIELLKALGTNFEVAELKLEAYAILSAMLPTYFWFQWNELTKLGNPMGLTEEESNIAIQQTLHAAMKLYFESGLSPEKVMDLIPVKPIGEQQAQITEIYQTKLLGLFEKIKP